MQGYQATMLHCLRTSATCNMAGILHVAASLPASSALCDAAGQQLIHVSWLCHHPPCMPVAVQRPPPVSAWHVDQRLLLHDPVDVKAGQSNIMTLRRPQQRAEAHLPSTDAGSPSANALLHTALEDISRFLACRCTSAYCAAGFPHAAHHSCLSCLRPRLPAAAHTQACSAACSQHQPVCNWQ